MIYSGMKFYKFSTMTKEFKTSMRVWVMRKHPMKGGHTHNHKMNKLMKSRLRSKAGRVYARVKSIRLLQKLDKS